jgi:hypothetical protein
MNSQPNPRLIFSRSIPEKRGKQLQTIGQHCRILEKRVPCPIGIESRSLADESTSYRPTRRSRILPPIRETSARVHTPDCRAAWYPSTAKSFHAQVRLRCRRLCLGLGSLLCRDSRQPCRRMRQVSSASLSAAHARHQGAQRSGQCFRLARHIDPTRRHCQQHCWARRERPGAVPPARSGDAAC